MAGLCAAVTPGRRGECLRAVPDDAPIRLCLVHALLAHQWIVQLGGAKAVAAQVKQEANR